MSPEEKRVDELLDQVRAQTTPRMARPDAVRAIRRLEAKLVEALDGRKLEGMPNLSTGRAPFPAVRVRDANYGQSLPWNTQPVLVLVPEGRLMLLKIVDTGAVVDGFSVEHAVVIPCPDDKLTAEDLQHVFRIMQAVLVQHLAKTADRSERFTAIHQLAKRLLDILI